jgi:xanthine dehydrogenase small subunit
MKRSIKFLANDSLVEAEARALDSALDFIRRDLGLSGTKEGCREGDCGACAVLVGERVAPSEGAAAPETASFSYRAMPSCLLVLGELEGRHLVTIEGLARSGAVTTSAASAKASPRLTPVMRAIAEANGSQCGFCSPGFVISLTAYLLNGAPLSAEGAFAAVEGNLCRCTGYGAIKRAAERLVEEYSALPTAPLERLEALAAAGVLPPSCLEFARGGFPGLSLPAGFAATSAKRAEAWDGGARKLALGGGSDYLVRNPEPDESSIDAYRILDREPELKRITREGDFLAFGAAVNWREFFSSPELLSFYPLIGSSEAILASPLVRERATLGGNIANASPVGDLTSMLIALGALIRVEGPSGSREMPVEKLFLGYKKLDLVPGEIISTILLPAPKTAARFNFEKASKREKLDIAAVNTAALFEFEGEVAPGAPANGIRITRARLSAGGVAPVPLLLAKTSAYLEGRTVDAGTVLEAARIAASEVSPIGDVRGSADYRKRVLERLVLAHFVRLFPGSGVEEAIE